MFKSLRIALFLLGCGTFASASFVACVVKEAPSIDALACTTSGECAPGFQCYLVEQQGALCLSNGDGLEPFVPSSGEQGVEPAGPEPTPEPGPEPAPEAGPEPSPEPGPEPNGPEPTGPEPEPSSGDSGSDAN